MLRPLEPEDLELLYTIENDAAMWDVSCRTAPLSRYHLRDYIASNSSDIFHDGQVRYVIEEDGKACGLLDIFSFEPLHNRAELGIVLLREARGKGIAQRAIAEACALCHDRIHLHQVYAVVPDDNIASRELFLNSGFSIVATLPQWFFDGSEHHDAIIFQHIL